MTGRVGAVVRVVGALGLSVAGAMGIDGCASPPPRPPDAARPADVHGRVDFGALFGRSFGNNTVLVTRREGGLMRRVMVGPNIVFESSRSSLAEPNTVGPANPTPSAPDQSNALGSSVSIGDSSRLLRYLVERGTVVVAPVISRIWCAGAENCAQASWVERTIMMARAAPQSAIAEAAGARDNQFMLPTAMLAVRYLGSSNFERPMVVEEGTGGQYTVRIAQYDSEPTQCRGLRLVVPYVTFSAEVISTSSGQVIARIDEVRAIATQAVTRRDVQVRSWQPVEARLPYNEGVHVYVGSWTPVPMLCDQIASQYATLRREIGEAADTSTTVQDLIQTSLDPLYRTENNDAPPRRAAPPPPPPPEPGPPAVTSPPTPAPLPPLDVPGNTRRRRRR